MGVNGMKFNRILIRIGLILAVLGSLVLSYFIWTNDQRFDNTRAKTETVKVADQDFNSLKNIISPTEVITAEKNEKTFQIYDKTRNIPVETYRLLTKAKLSNLKSVRGKNETYTDMLKDSDFIQLVYPDKLSVETFSKIFEIQTNNLTQDIEFNRLFIPIDDSKKVYLGSDKDEKLYSLNCKNFSVSELQKLVKTSSRRSEVNLQKVGNQYTPFYKNATKVGIYSYLTNSQPESFYVSKLLGTSEIESKSKDNQAVYTSGLYKRIIIDRPGNVVTFNNYADTTVPKHLAAIVNRGYSYLTKSGIAVNDLKYFSSGKDYLNYRSYVEGLPVFYQDSNVPALQVNFFHSGINMGLYNLNLQIPIPTDNRSVTIPSTKDILAALKKKGINREDIQRMELGFRVVPDPNVDKLVDLMPTVYLKIYNEWKTYTEWQTVDIKILKTQRVEEG